MDIAKWEISMMHNTMPFKYFATFVIFLVFACATSKSYAQDSQEKSSIPTPYKVSYAFNIASATLIAPAVFAYSYSNFVLSYGTNSIADKANPTGLAFTATCIVASSVAAIMMMMNTSLYKDRTSLTASLQNDLEHFSRLRKASLVFAIVSLVAMVPFFIVSPMAGIAIIAGPAVIFPISFTGSILGSVSYVKYKDVVENF